MPSYFFLAQSTPEVDFHCVDSVHSSVSHTTLSQKAEKNTTWCVGDSLWWISSFYSNWLDFIFSILCSICVFFLVNRCRHAVYTRRGWVPPDPRYPLELSTPHEIWAVFLLIFLRWSCNIFEGRLWEFTWSMYAWDVWPSRQKLSTGSIDNRPPWV